MLLAPSRALGHKARMTTTETAEYVDFATARDARGVRIVVVGAIPSPWSQAAKGVFRVAGVPAKLLRYAPTDAETTAWMGARNVPVVLHDDAPPRTGAAEIVSLADRLSGGALLPRDAERRIRTFGLLNELAGEEGLGSCGRAMMIQASLESDGARGFPLPLAKYLATRYRHGDVVDAPARIAEILATLDRELANGRASGGAYFAGERPGALDVYSATFLTTLASVSEADCPAMRASLRPALAYLHSELGATVPTSLLEHRMRMLEQHLGLPIAL